MHEIHGSPLPNLHTHYWHPSLRLTTIVLSDATGGVAMTQQLCPGAEYNLAVRVFYLDNMYNASCISLGTALAIITHTHHGPGNHNTYASGPWQS